LLGLVPGDLLAGRAGEGLERDAIVQHLEAGWPPTITFDGDLGGSGLRAAAGDYEGAKVGLHGACLEVNVAFPTPILDTLVSRV
jgi:hypothetical protein